MASSRKRAIDSDDDSSSDDELDEQLLSLSTKKAKNSPTVAAKKMADSDSDKDENSDSSTDDSDNEWTLDSEGNGKSNNKKKNGKTQKPTPAKRRASTVSDEEEDGEINDEEDNEEEEKEEGQVMSSSSSSDDDGSDEDLPAFDDGLDANLIGDEEDRLKLEEMTEKDREIELYNRMEKREAMKVRLEIERKLHGKRKTERKQHKKEKDKKSGDDKKSKEPEVYNSSIASRKGERKKTVEDVKKKAINELKQKRIEKKEKMEALMSKKEPLTTKDVYSDDDDDEEEDDEDNNKEEEDSDKSSVEFASDDEDAEEERLSQQIETREQLEDIRLSRHKLEQWVHLPFFTRVISGCFLRMGIGNHDGRAIYRVAEIIDVTETSKVYNLGKTRTNKGVKVRHGLQERIFRMEYVSNQAFTDSEFQKWKEEMKLVELPLPTLRQVKEKSADISTSKAYSYKDDDIEAIVKEKNKFRKNPFNYAVKKNRLIREKEIAEQTNDYKKLEKVKGELDELEERAQMLDKKRSGALSNVSFINERNRKKNVYDAEKACIEEGRQNKEKKDDPFTRRKTQPKMIIKSTAQEQKTDESINSEAQDTSTGEFAEPAPELDSLLFKSELTVSGVNKSSDDADLFSAHDFDVQIDVPIPAARTISLTPKPMVHQRENVSRRSLNLDEYKKRKGLM
ncbi:RNA polymerase-associated protein RTF1 homolog [Hydractinia symbiolongicarpus]|uniref:RNA polymerase-associated protein RTF1 homolog n=1 Tax=Hydractinia symbiolongicarpus TaxID=13093 RepID=UPI00254C6C88|nr:RNA polymerase-associated protein RTF1 homolog [Hydractinia symbiolongicarpus]